jgi:curli biogenesis system outer membrane secretion channel CsgG
MKKTLLLLLLIASLYGCAGVAKIDPTAFIPDTGPKETIPPVCKSAYELAIPKVAVVNFTNNTTFEYAKMVQASVQGSSQRTAVGGAAVAVVPGAAGIVWGQKEQAQFQADSQRIEREVNAKLSESVEDGVINELVNMGGSEVFTRNEMQKVLEEHKFQASGLVDEKSLIQFGKLAGVKFIVTGSVNNVNLKWVSLEETKRGLQKHLGLIGSIAAAGMEQQEGWNIDTDIALRIIDVETGKIVFTKSVTGKHIIGKTPYPNYDALIGGIKKAAQKAIADARPELSRWFTLRGYILQTRTSPDGKQRAALVNLGYKHGLKEDMQLIVYTFHEIEDPNSGKKSCNKVKLPVTLKATNQIEEEMGWFIVDGDEQSIKRVKTGQLVERAQLKGAGFFEKLGH